ncbi:hypothetical protein OIU77_021636 [Salix suchowensis]|uniref:Uncharacterized protein n=1 Tax=Salix suchowensis TaxID=1278906 RepID=A0ABQ9CAJ0_9ROSI|nr:hypothetical protein OIU77_021636 [Salix suchowensis]
MQFMFDSAGHRITVGWRKATPACHRVKVVSLPSDRIDSPRSTLLCESHVEQVISERRTFAADHRTSTVYSSKAFWILEDMACGVDSSGRSGGSPSSTDHQGADDGADKPGGSRRLAVRSAGFHGGLPIETDRKIEIPISNIRETSLNDPQTEEHDHTHNR